MTCEVIHQDFGKSGRDAARAFIRLFKLCQEQEADVLANPGKHLELAYKQMAELRNGIREAADSLMPDFAGMFRPDASPRDLVSGAVYVREDQYRRLEACAEIVRRLDRI